MKNNRNPFKNRFLSCAAIGLYAFALIILPGLHEHGCEHSESAPSLHDSGDSCPICEFAVLAVPFLAISEPLLWQADADLETSFSLSIPPVSSVTDLPPCRAPPVG